MNNHYPHKYTKFWHKHLSQAIIAYNKHSCSSTQRLQRCPEEAIVIDGSVLSRGQRTAPL